MLWIIFNGLQDISNFVLLKRRQDHSNQPHVFVLSNKAGIRRGLAWFNMHTGSRGETACLALSKVQKYNHPAL